MRTAEEWKIASRKISDEAATKVIAALNVAFKGSIPENVSLDDVREEWSDYIQEELEKFASVACKEQREICSRAYFAGSAKIFNRYRIEIEKAIENAPSPEMK
jgi:HEPN domain-containing protein